jgi:hypothetical protein
MVWATNAFHRDSGLRPGKVSGTPDLLQYTGRELPALAAVDQVRT